MSDPRSRIPSVDSLLDTEAFTELVERFGRSRVVEAIRRAVEQVRAAISDTAGLEGAEAWEGRVTDPETYAALASAWLEAGDVPSLRRVVNATGVVLHTNLGRAPLASVAVDAMRAAAGEYSNLEYDLEGGVRGSRYSHCVSLLTELIGAEDALVVNNAAGALVLAINTLALGEGVAVSRGELVEIGGGFRIPEVLQRAGARLLEVGSTNRTRASDYVDALEGHAGRALLKVHRSNFRITGFTEEVSVADLAQIARDFDVPLVHDLGSGLMVAAASVGLPEEPRAGESLTSGADVVVVSGDKLLGGPQAGILVGSRELLGRMRKNPLCRALRVDKVTLAGLEATLRLYRDEARARAEIPVLRMISAHATGLRERAETLHDGLVARDVQCTVVESTGAVGGGTFPGVELPSWAVELQSSAGANALAHALRQGNPPVIGRILDERVRLDVRTLLPGQESHLLRRVEEAMATLETES